MGEQHRPRGRRRSAVAADANLIRARLAGRAERARAAVHCPRTPNLARACVPFAHRRSSAVARAAAAEASEVGVLAATLRDDDLKNVCYNALDVVSKNFYGFFLFVYAVWLV